jgi:exodeoxyribonuclease-1
MADTSFYWHDYETFGAVPRRDRPAQFAGVRTDAELNELAEPLVLHCRPADDTLPEPEACLITGIVPQHCQRHGVSEAEFAAAIEQQLAQPGTVGVGYNSIRFDDEVTRFLFWRCLIDPYAREWQHDCGRWDLLDVMRCAWALRPEGLNWPRNDAGTASFRLEDLSRANALDHANAHDALADVRATLALARLLKRAQPKLWDFCLSLRKTGSGSTAGPALKLKTRDIANASFEGVEVKSIIVGACRPSASTGMTTKPSASSRVATGRRSSPACAPMPS